MPDPDVIATITVGFEPTTILTLVSSSPAGTVVVNQNSTTIDLLPSSSEQKIFALTFVPDTSENVSSVVGATPDPVGTATAGSPTVVPSGGSGTVTLTCTYPSDPQNLPQIKTSTLTFITGDSEEH